MHQDGEHAPWEKDCGVPNKLRYKHSQLHSSPTAEVQEAYLASSWLFTVKTWLLISKAAICGTIRKQRPS